jgi:hypothetical protein
VSLPATLDSGGINSYLNYNPFHDTHIINSRDIGLSYFAACLHYATSACGGTTCSLSNEEITLLCDLNYQILGT